MSRSQGFTSYVPPVLRLYMAAAVQVLPATSLSHVCWAAVRLGQPRLQVSPSTLMAADVFLAPSPAR
ncbi:MAG: hypothetical protein EOO41_04160 [Methanobacteriota archaeon]|nr:MAG: hypothetical protein EOO41_04160 [Euryarchaeota archaeon]